MNVLFVCTGNTCRSPMAEALLRKMNDEVALQIDVCSAGISANYGNTASDQAVEVLNEKGIQHPHSSQAVNDQLMGWADLILTMTSHHKYYLQRSYPQFIQRIYTLKEYVNGADEVNQLHAQLENLLRDQEELKSSIKAQKNEWSQEDELEWLEKAKPLIEQQEKLIYQLQLATQKMDIVDPFGGDVTVYRECANEIECLLREMVQQWRER